ncbi:hypothetical protein ACFSRY_09720 [Pontibacter locisalis]|uniref:Uncharacterized protein n=1 Tax=Pontibacter locisalis TaxID=1719035 RepID=A0ABW5IMC1_9BACT
MKILVLLFGIILGFCLVCKDTFDVKNQVAQRQQLLASTNAPTVVQPQAINML